MIVKQNRCHWGEPNSRNASLEYLRINCCIYKVVYCLTSKTHLASVPADIFNVTEEYVNICDPPSPADFQVTNFIYNIL